MGKRIGTILHGALGDCYEQILCTEIYKERFPESSMIAFFASENRYKAFRHFDISVFDEIYLAKDIEVVDIEEFYQYQIEDVELQEEIISGLKLSLRKKFDLKKNILPWKILRRCDFQRRPLSLQLSRRGLQYLKRARIINNVNDGLFENNFVVGFLWRYRKKGLIDSRFQYPLWFIKKNLEEFFSRIIKQYDAHVLIAGMNRGSLKQLRDHKEIIEEAGLGLGERRNSFADFVLDIDEKHVTYLKGVGYAAEMEIMSKCNLLLVMPSGFSEPLWMRQRQPVVMLYPPLKYLARLWIRRMPFFNNSKWRSRYFNTFQLHSSKNVFSHLCRMNYLPRNPKCSSQSWLKNEVR